MHKLWWSGCKRFTSGHGIAGTVSGVEAAIHCGDELWFGVGMENAALSTLASPLNQRSLPLATVKPTLKQRRLQRCTAKATPVFSIFPHFVRGDERCRNSAPSPYRSRNAPTKFGRYDRCGSRIGPPAVFACGRKRLV